MCRRKFAEWGSTTVDVAGTREFLAYSYVTWFKFFSKDIFRLQEMLLFFVRVLVCVCVCVCVSFCAVDHICGFGIFLAVLILQLPACHVSARTRCVKNVLLFLRVTYQLAFYWLIFLYSDMHS
jgi:hypothetical protein